MTSFMEIAITAGTLAAQCVARPPHLGGTDVVGPRGVMNVTILGRSPRPSIRLPGPEPSAGSFD